MSKYLTIIRHAKSSWDNPNLKDIERPLNERGRKAIKTIGTFLTEKAINPDFMITSPAKRAKQTAIGIGKFLNYKTTDLQICDEMYFSQAASILTIINTINNKYNDVFIFGHEPILSELIELLTKNKLDKFPTCAVYRIAFDTESWKDITSATLNCEFYVNPKLLMKK